MFPASPILRLYLLPSCFARRAKEVNFIGLNGKKKGDRLDHDWTPGLDKRRWMGAPHKQETKVLVHGTLYTHNIVKTIAITVQCRAV